MKSRGCAIYYFLTESVKRRVILELRRYWSYHPKYPDLPDHIQGKYSFRERPQYGIVIKTGSANRVDLSPDNYLGVVRQGHAIPVRLPTTGGDSRQNPVSTTSN